MARLFAEILKDAGFRSVKNCVETSGQRLKQDGVDAFRKLLKTAENVRHLPFYCLRLLEVILLNM